MGGGDDPCAVAFAALRLRRVRGHSLLQGARRGQILRVPPARPYGTAASQLQDCPDRVALQRRRADGRHVGSHPCQQASGLLYPPIGIPRLRRHGGRPDRGARGRRHRRVALGRLPGRRRAGKRRGRGHLLVAPALEQRHSAGGEGHGLLHELHPREDGGEGPRLCRGHHVERGGACLRGHGRELVHRAQRRAFHAAAFRRTSRGHHPRHGAVSGRRPGDPCCGGKPHPQRPVHRR